MAKNDSKITGATKAIPGGAKKDASFTKRSAATQKMDAGRKGPREDYGPRTSANSGTPLATDDKAGTRSRADLPPETRAMKAPEAMLPSAVKDMASPVLPVPSADTELFTVEPFDYARDRKLGRMGS